VRVIGSREELASDLSSLLDEAEDLTRDNSGLTLVIAFNYGGRQEIAEAAKQLAIRAMRGEIDPASIDPAAISASLYTAEIPDPDLIIRTSGEQRLSNFLMWQCAYAELVFLPIHWPDFDRAALESALAQYGSRERRFGGLAARNAMTGS
jgi:undecaprenyl diphosphate synthase